MQTIALPKLAVEHVASEPVCLSLSPYLFAHRSNRPKDAADTIFVGASSSAGALTLNLTPALVVALANTMLTDSERSCITFTPAIAGGHTE